MHILGPVSICESCRWFKVSLEGRNRDVVRFHCRAYEGAIPERILNDGFDHRKPYFGDGGVRWEMDYERAHMFLHYLDDVENGKFTTTGLALDGERAGGEAERWNQGRGAWLYPGLGVRLAASDGERTHFRGAHLPRGWLRALSLPTEISVPGQDGRLVKETVLRADEAYLRKIGWSKREINHAIRTVQSMS